MTNQLTLFPRNDYEILIQMVNEIGEDALKSFSGNAAAGVRYRKGLGVVGAFIKKARKENIQFHRTQIKKKKSKDLLPAEKKEDPNQLKLN